MTMSRLFRTGIAPLDKLLPRGIPRNNMTIIAGEIGAGKSVIMHQLLYSLLRAGEPCLFVNFEGPTIVVEQDMQSFGWDIHPYLDKGMLRFLDCFSFRLEPSVQSDPYSHYVKDPKDLRAVSTALFSMMDEMGMTGRGAVFVDSLTEMFTLVQADSPLVYTMLDGIKSWRAKGPKERLVPFFCTHHVPLRAYADLDDLLFYVVDGIFEVGFNPGFAERGLLVKQLRIRRMKGAPHEGYWMTFTVNLDGIKEVPLPIPALAPVLENRKPRTNKKK